MLKFRGCIRYAQIERHKDLDLSISNTTNDDTQVHI